MENYTRGEGVCAFCTPIAEEIIASNKFCYAISDQSPQNGHCTAVIPKRHVSNFFELQQWEINAVHALLLEVKQQIERQDQAIGAFNVSVNSGQEAGQTVLHCHIQLIPQRHHDTNPQRRGKRRKILEKEQC